MKIIIVYIVFLNTLFAQDFLEVKFSINDIQHQRNLFSENKIKKIIANNNYSQDEFSVSEEGKIISKNYIYENLPHIYTYFYEGSNLIEIKDLQNSKITDNYLYDIKRNVEKSMWSGVVNSYSYDGNNNLLNVLVVESVDACDYPMVGDTKTMYYKDGKLTEIRWNCYEDTYSMSRFIYDGDGRISKILQISAKCSNNSESVSSTSQYTYTGKMQLPDQILNEYPEGNDAINFKYEYYE